MIGLRGILPFFLKQQKRLFSRPSFLILLALIVVMSFALSIVSDKSGGLVRVGIADNAHEPMVYEIKDKIMRDGVMVHFEHVGEEEGRKAVESGDLDAVWIFAEDFSYYLREAAMDRASYAPVTVVTGEDSPLNALARETLYSAMFPYAARMLYEGFNEEELGLSEEQSAAVFDEMELNDGVMAFETLSGDKPLKSGDFIRTTLRGLLSLCVLLCAFACVMYSLKDVSDGVYEFLPQRSRFIPLMTGVFAGTLDAGIVACVALALSGNRMNLTDIAGMLTYVFAATAFAFLVGSACARREVVGTVLPVVIFVCAVMCPVFIDVGGPMAVRVLLPTFLYLKSYGDPVYLIHMAVYTFLATAVSYPIFCIRTKK